MTTSAAFTWKLAGVSLCRKFHQCMLGLNILHHRHTSPTHSFAPAVNKTEKQKDISHLSRKLNIHQKQHRRGENYFIRIIEFIILSYPLLLYIIYSVFWRYAGEDPPDNEAAIVMSFCCHYLSSLLSSISRYFSFESVNIDSSQSCIT